MWVDSWKVCHSPIHSSTQAKACLCPKSRTSRMTWAQIPQMKKTVENVSRICGRNRIECFHLTLYSCGYFMPPTFLYSLPSLDDDSWVQYPQPFASNVWNCIRFFFFITFSCWPCVRIAPRVSAGPTLQIWRWPACRSTWWDPACLSSLPAGGHARSSWTWNSANPIRQKSHIHSFKTRNMNFRHITRRAAGLSYPIHRYHLIIETVIYTKMQ